MHFRCALPALVATALLASTFAATARADISLLQVDENGGIKIDGVAPPTGGTLATDPISSQTALTYNLPFTGNPGDMIIKVGSQPSELLRFPGNGTVEFFALPTFSTTLSSSIAPGATNFKAASVTNFVSGRPVQIDSGASAEIVTAIAVGTSGATGTGVNVSLPFFLSHPSGTTVLIAKNLGNVFSLPSAVANNSALTRTSGSSYTVFWQPGGSGVGGDALNPGITYAFQSSVTLPAPEPTSLLLLGLGALPLLRRRGKTH